MTMGSLDALNAGLTAWLAPVFSTPALRWIAMCLLCGPYLQGGLTKALNFGGAIAEMKQFGLKPPAPLAIAVIVMEIGASILVLSGFFRWAGALMLAGFTLYATFLTDRFWDAAAPKRDATENSFFEHVGLVGGLLLVAAFDLHG
jgi:uncharacterized membrane protein YphA (DoxX/SURF4 family)